MKNFFNLLSLILLLASCSPGRSTTAVKHPPKSAEDEKPRFLENITIKPSADNANAVKKTVTVPKENHVSRSMYSTDIEKCNYLQFKYAILMEEKVESVTNEKLIGFLEDWYGTPYRYGGGTKTGIDCSAFTSFLIDSVYGVNIPRTSKSQYEAGKKVSKKNLAQGDLVFFNTRGGISHVGVFLANNKFVHASTSSGVMISDLNDVYFSRRYVGATRVK